MVLIPGAPFGWRVWDEFMARNKDRFTMYAVTLPGYGGTDPYAMPTTTRTDGTPDFERTEWSDAVVDAMSRLIVHEKLDRPIIVSVHLIADVIALRVGLDHPELVRGIVVTAGSPGFRLPPGVTDRTSWLYNDRAPFYRTVSESTWRHNMVAPSRLSADASYARVLVSYQRTVPIPSQVRFFMEYLATDLRPRLSQLMVPILALETPTQFELLPEPARAAFMARTNNDTQAAKRLYESAPHWGTVATRPPQLSIKSFTNAPIFVMHDDPAAFDRVIADFVASVR
jgi:pimeloyl-ACP methyl ester carboxylesterase